MTLKRSFLEPNRKNEVFLNNLKRSKRKSGKNFTFKKMMEFTLSIEMIKALKIQLLQLLPKKIHFVTNLQQNTKILFESLRMTFDHIFELKISLKFILKHFNGEMMSLKLMKITWKWKEIDLKLSLKEKDLNQKIISENKKRNWKN